MKNFLHSLVNFCLPFFMKLNWLRHTRPLYKAAVNPGVAQARTLKKILCQNAGAKFLRHHDLSGDTDREEFARKVPIRDFEALKPWIDAQHIAREGILCTEPAKLYVKTSGTTNQPKLLPITKHGFQEYKQQQSTAGAILYQMIPEAFEGKILAITSPALENTTEFGFPVGSASGQLYLNAPWLFKSKYVVPAWVLDISDYELKYLLILRLALQDERISYLSAANPATFLALLDLFEQYAEELLPDLRSNTFFRIDQLSTQDAKCLQKLLRKNSHKADQLESIHKQGEKCLLRDLFPNARALVTWTGGSAGICCGLIAHQLPDTCQIIELGYIASEFRGTLPFCVEHNGGIPTLDKVFFEFVEEQSWYTGNRKTVGIQEILPGYRYFIIVTTISGLYRYFINDLIEVVDYFKATPLIRFVQKGQGTTNISGEKLAEAQVLQAISENSLSPKFAIMLAVATERRYHFLIEDESIDHLKLGAIALALDESLIQSNIEYQHKRHSKRLLPLQMSLVPKHTGARFKQHSLNQGQRGEQFKPPLLANIEDLDFDFSRYVH